MRDAVRRRLPDAVPGVPAVLLAITVIALLLRTVALGGRVFHWDEGRVAYWTLRYQQSGVFAYRPIIHGPFVQHANHLLFDLLGANDFVARLPVALVGGLLPLSAWLFRNRLDDVEVLALAGVLALNPLLVYYSRFLRSDVLVGAFAFVAFGFAVRAWDDRDVRLLYTGVVALALGFASKENAFVYVACFLGAAVLMYDHRLVRTTGRVWTPSSPLSTATTDGTTADATTDGTTADATTDGTTADATTDDDGGPATDDEAVTDGGTGAVRGARDQVVADLRSLPRLANDLSRDVDARLWTGLHLTGLAATFLAVIVFMYAPRPALWEALAAPGQLPGVVSAATVGAWSKFYSVWGTGHGNPYFPFLHDLLVTLLYGAPIVCAMAALGFVADGYLGLGATSQRSLVAYAFYWGVASVVGYPVATDIQAPWAGIHVLLPLAIPAAVGVAAVVRETVAAVDAEDAARVALAGTVLLAAVVTPVALTADYWNAASQEDEEVLQWAQPANDLQATMADVRAVARSNDGIDVLFVGTENPHSGNVEFYVPDESSARQAPVSGPGWHSRLPLPWYLERAGAEVASSPPSQTDAEIASDAPPVVIAVDFDTAATSDADADRVHGADDVGPHLEGYERRRHAFKLWGEHVVIFIDEHALAAADESDG